MSMLRYFGGVAAYLIAGAGTAFACDLASSDEYLALKEKTIREKIASAEMLRDRLFYGGQSELQQRRYKIAMAKFEETIAEDPNCAAAHVYLGHALSNVIRESTGWRDLAPDAIKEHFSGVYGHYERAIEVDPSFGLPHYFWVESLKDQVTQKSYPDFVPFARAYRLALEAEPNFSKAKQELTDLLAGSVMVDLHHIAHFSPLDGKPGLISKPEYVLRGRRMICFAREAEPYLLWRIESTASKRQGFDDMLWLVAVYLAQGRFDETPSIIMAPENVPDETRAIIELLLLKKLLLSYSSYLTEYERLEEYVLPLDCSEFY